MRVRQGRAKEEHGWITPFVWGPPNNNGLHPPAYQPVYQRL